MKPLSLTILAFIVITAFPNTGHTQTQAEEQNETQAISTSMIRCSALYFHMANLTKKSGQTAQSNTATKIAKDFYNRAYEQAAAEGLKNAHDVLDPKLTIFTKSWGMHFKDPTMIKENGEWANYCKSLGTKAGITIK